MSHEMLPIVVKIDGISYHYLFIGESEKECNDFIDTLKEFDKLTGDDFLYKIENKNVSVIGRNKGTK